MLERLVANWPLKLLSLVLAFGIWVSITGERRILRNFDIALDPRLRPDCILAVNPPTQVTVRLEGPESIVRKLDPLELSVRLDLTDTPPGEREVQLTEAHLVGRPPRVAVEFFDPPRVRLVVDEKVVRQLPTAPTLVGTPPRGYFVYQASVVPQTVLVEGPASEVGTLTHVGTDPVGLGGRVRRFIESVSAVPDRPHVRVVEPQPLEVRVEIDEAPVERRIEGVPVVPSDASGPTAFRPPAVEVVLSGPPELLERLVRSQLRAIAEVERDAGGSSTRRATVTAELDLPADQLARVSVRAVKPQQVAVLRAPGSTER